MNTRALGTAIFGGLSTRRSALGLYDLDRNIRKVGASYKQLIQDWRRVLPAQSVCLVVPVVLPSEYDNPVVHRRRELARQLRRRPTPPEGEF